MYPSSILVAATFATIALARTDLVGCTSTDVSSPAGASIAWYVPETGELCDFLDCGGGRAPPKTTVPGCAAYSGTETYSPSYLPGFGSASEAPTPSVESTTSEAAITGSTSEAVSSEGSSQASVYPSSTPSSRSSVETTTSTSPSLSTSTSTITSAPIVPVSGNGTISSPSGDNGTISNGSPSSSATFDAGAAGDARVFIGGAGVMALAAAVAVAML